jgi:acetolactate synthase-1/2/3 large subunit
MIVGGGARRADAEVRRLAERLSAPVVCSVNGKGTLPDDHPLAMGAGLQRRNVAGLVGESDLVVVVGCELAPADLWEGPLDLDGKVVRIDVDPEQSVVNAMPVATVLGDAGEALAAITSATARPSKPTTEHRHAWVRSWRSRFGAEAAELAAPWKSVLEPIADVVGPDGIVAGDSAKICYFGAVPGLPSHGPSRFLYPSGYGTLGYGLPAAIGAKTAFPERRVLCLIGDGGLMFTLAELASAAQLDLAIPVVVADNDGFGEIRDEMEQRGQSSLGVDLWSPDFVSVARGLGCEAFEVAGSEELHARLEQAFLAEVPTLLHVHTA